MTIRLLPVLIGFAAAVLYALNAWRAYSEGDAGAALNWLIGGACISAGYTLMHTATRRNRGCARTVE
ncbi:MAG: hypothetical protein RKE49_13865 [Oceanicaulis sp.]